MILVAHSNVFKRMFSTPNCKETQTGIIEIKDFKAPIIEALIQFMHIEEVDNLEPNAIDLFKVADKYNVEGLKVSLIGSNLFLLGYVCQSYCEYSERRNVL